MPKCELIGFWGDGLKDGFSSLLGNMGDGGQGELASPLSPHEDSPLPTYTLYSFPNMGSSTLTIPQLTVFLQLVITLTYDQLMLPAVAIYYKSHHEPGGGSACL